MSNVPYISLFFLFLSGHRCSTAAVDKDIWSPGGCWSRYRGQGRAERFRLDQSSAPPGCGGEGSWHRDLMHKEKQKSHCQGFPLFHSSAGDRVIFPQWDAFSLLWLYCFFFLFFFSYDIWCCYGVRGINIGEVRRILWSALLADFKRFTCGISFPHKKPEKNTCLPCQMFSCLKLKLSSLIQPGCKCIWEPYSFMR